MQKSNYDFVVLGGGAAALSAVRTARNAGANVAMVTDAPPGGDCTFTGCVPSKTLIEGARRGLDFADAMANVHRVVERIAATESVAVLRSEGVDVIEGRGSFFAKDTLDVDGKHVSAPRIMIATGSRASLPPIPGLSDVGALTNESLWDLEVAPTSLGILGGGPIGCEMADAFVRLGVPVTVFEAADRVLGREEPEASAIVGDALMAQGVDVRLSTTVTSLTRTEGGIEVDSDAARVTVSHLLVAVGRTPNTENLGLEELGVRLDQRGYVITNESLGTDVDGIWAAGDVNGKMPFTHAADEMGRLVAWTALRRGQRYKFVPEWIPRVTFTSPEVASVGTLEADAPRSARVLELPMAGNDRAIAAGDEEGFIKLIVGPHRVMRNVGGGRVLGATIVAPRAGEMIHEPTLAMRTRMFAGRLAQTVHAYPTWSVGIQKAAGMLFYEIEGRKPRPVRHQR